MLHQFILDHRDVIIAKTRTRLQGRLWPRVTPVELESGVPLFLTQLTENLRLEATGAPHSANGIGITATQHGREVSELGFTIGQVVQDYGDICQAITETAVETRAPITAEEFRTLNRLFQAFGDRRNSDRAGLGMGLSIARHAVRAHGGEITIRNLPGKGCVLTIEMPLTSAALAV